MRRLLLVAALVAAARGSSLVEEAKASCTVDSGRVRTFDDVISLTTLTTCYSVLTKDCSERPEFAVLIKKLSKNGEEKKMKIVTRESVIELEMDKRSDKMRVTIDWEEVDDVEQLEEAGVYMKNDLVRVELDDVTVEFDGYTANIEVSECYKNKQCGICGDLEKMEELRRADKEELEDIEAYHRSVLLKNEECERSASQKSDCRHKG